MAIEATTVSLHDDRSTGILLEGQKLVRVLELFCCEGKQWPQVKAFIQASFLDLSKDLDLSPEVIRQSRQDILDALEAYFGKSQHWSSIRNKTLNAFGDLGLGRLIHKS